MRIFRILKKPITTEKTSVLELNNNTYVFEVDSSATKIDIKKSISELYKVEVASVNVLHTREKFKYGKKRGMQLRKRSTKKAYVTLKDTKAKIDFSIIK
ncbi:MAG: 50S ribosomal protein L23 [Candidatus Gracilibacteria bacterium]|nr:50S ribosomal protein L23 [Candidatus Gracilibacteria bacterium]